MLPTAICYCNYKELRWEINLNLHGVKTKPVFLLQQLFKETVVDKSMKHVKSMNQI